ncbi:hypothetical protein [Empedobacter falsenii]|uniref:Uncharacterized protein n=2 Tax=Empedobacter TaxID=59734 RepID=A0A7H9DP98_9FLAO|nr:hypothetical protein [Empedobacter falsenii]QLL56825.1 hypothetical protein FH779_01420 [Empedobacter falsenii]
MYREVRCEYSKCNGENLYREVRCEYSKCNGENLYREVRCEYSSNFSIQFLSESLEMTNKQGHPELVSGSHKVDDEKLKQVQLDKKFIALSIRRKA